jgi:hypothetical protein
MGNTSCCQNQNIDHAQTVMPFMNKENNRSKEVEFSGEGLSLIRKATRKEKESSLISDKIYSLQEDNLNILSNREISLNDQTEFLKNLPSINSFQKGAARFSELNLRVSRSPFVIPENISQLLDGYKLKLFNYYKFYKELKENSESYSCEFKLKFFGNIEGQYVCGYGQIILEGSYFYEGEIKQNLPHGFGIFFYSPEVVYYGDYVSGKREGHGILEFKGTRMYLNKLRRSVAE